MAYKSKYSNLNSVPPGWKKKDYVWIVEKLETMPREKLLNLCDLPQINLRFLDIRGLDTSDLSDEKLTEAVNKNPDGWKEVESEDEIISALVSDFTPETLIPAIKKITGD